MDTTHQTRIAITDMDKQTGTYSWKSSDPRGFAEWFASRNSVFANLAPSQKRRLFESTLRAMGRNFMPVSMLFLMDWSGPHCSAQFS
jgi:hypothetical protein